MYYLKKYKNIYEKYISQALQLTKVKSKAFNIPQLHMMRSTNCMIKSILYARFVFMLTGISTFKRRSSLDCLMTSTSTKRTSILYPTIFKV